LFGAPSYAHGSDELHGRQEQRDADGHALWQRVFREVAV
jgi:hypothetical protein